MIMDSPQETLSLTFVAKAINKPTCPQRVSDKLGEAR